MGYYSFAQGELRVVAGKEKEIDNDLLEVFDKEFGEGITELISHVDYNVSSEGADSAVVGFSSRGKLYYIEEDVIAIVSFLVAKYDAAVNGRLYVSGEDAVDLWRIAVVDNKVTSEEARVSFPDGSVFGQQ